MGRRWTLSFWKTHPIILLMIMFLIKHFLIKYWTLLDLLRNDAHLSFFAKLLIYKVLASGMLWNSKLNSEQKILQVNNLSVMKRRFLDIYLKKFRLSKYTVINIYSQDYFLDYFIVIYDCPGPESYFNI